MVLIRGAAALTAAKWPAVTAFWLLTVALTALPRLFVASMGPGANGMRAVTNGEVLYTGVAPLLIACVSAMVFRTVLRPPTGRTPEGGAWLYVILIGGLGAIQALATIFLQGSGLPIGQIGLALSLTGYAVALIGPIFALWPVGLVMGGPARSPGRAVGAMQGAYLGFVLAVILVCLLPTALATGLTIVQVRAGVMPGPPMVLLGAGISAAMKFAGFLLAAEVFRRRYLRAQDVSGVFD